MAAVQGVTVSADLPGTVERIAFDSGQAVRAGRRARRARHAAGAGAAGRRSRRSASWPGSNFDRMQGLLDEQRHLAGGVRSRDGRAQADRRAGRRNPRGDRAQDDPRAVLGILGIRQVNLGQYLAGGDAVVTLQSLESDLRELRRAAAGRSARCASGAPVAVNAGDRRRRRSSPGASRRSTRSSTRRPGTSRCRRRWPTRAAQLRPGMFVQTERDPRRQPGGRRAAGVGDQLRAVRRLGLRRRPS